MYSMTGYGKAEYSGDGIELTVELKTVNNRFLEVIPKYPRMFISSDDKIRKAVQQKIKRGRVELFVTYSDKRQLPKAVEVDISLAKGYMEAATALMKEFPSLEDDFTLTSLMRTPDVLSQTNTAENTEELEKILIETVQKACDNLNMMRQTEGEKLKGDLLKRIDTIGGIVDKIKKRAPLVAEDYAQRLREKVENYLAAVKPDETRLLQEVALFADKSNIDEELTRLYSHVSQFKSIVNEAEAGKKLDFLVQEFNREANTICSKANDIEITNAGLSLKCEIEKVREQIQNLE